MIGALRDLFSFKRHPAKEEPSTPTTIPALSVDVIRLLLSRLEGADLARASTVCRLWNRAVKESDFLRSKIFVKFPEPLREFLSMKENYGIPTLKIDGTICKEKSNDEYLVIKLPNRELIYSLKITPEIMSAPLMFVQEPWKRTAIAIKYHVTYPDGSEGDLAFVLHEAGAHQPGIWWSSQDKADIKDSYPRVISYAMVHSNIFVKLSILFRKNWQKNQGGEFGYLKMLLNDEPCGRIEWNPEIVATHYSILEPTFKNEKGEDIAYIRICSRGANL